MYVRLLLVGVTLTEDEKKSYWIMGGVCGGNVGAVTIENIAGSISRGSSNLLLCLCLLLFLCPLLTTVMTTTMPLPF